ncbi:unnamed protein product [Heligmosomoides polygyrus]|uniref:Kelch repeat protein n=1 Tax=Heligmosomoides polygyrus TaxID=6339 RepID=A0A183FSK1_HELPZ|nr:unnamed protein product [Heligmosomoides polygyrus]
MFVFYYLKDGGSRCGIHFRGSEIRLEPFFEYAFRSIRLQVFSFGGYCSGETVDPEQPIDIHMLDTRNPGGYSSSNDEMEPLRSLPYQRYGHTVCAYRGRAYLWGGRNDDYGASSTLHEFDPVLLRWRIVPVEGRVPPARDGHSAVVVGDRMFLFGGFEEDLQRFSQETYVFDFLTNRWSEFNTTGQPPLWRDFHTAVAIDSKMYIFGGRSDYTGQVSETFHSTRDMYDERLKALDLRTGEWSDPICNGVGPTGRRSHSAWTYGGKMYIFGGYLGTQNMHYDDLFSFDPSTNHWEKIKMFAALRCKPGSPHSGGFQLRSNDRIVDCSIFPDFELF